MMAVDTFRNQPLLLENWYQISFLRNTLNEYQDFR